MVRIRLLGKNLFRGKRGIVVCLILAAAMFGIVNIPSAVRAAATARQLPIYCVQRDQKLVSISFDAAWGDVSVRQSSGRILSGDGYRPRTSEHKDRNSCAGCKTVA